MSHGKGKQTTGRYSAVVLSNKFQLNLVTLK